MRWFGLLLAGLLLPAPATAEETDSPFRGKLRQASDETGVVSITVPERWTDKERGGDILIRVYATGGGGHDIMVIREAGQGDVDALRDRYLEHDNGRYPGSSVEKLAEPYFGYRLHDPARKQVVLRAFATHGSTGIILSISSRDARYDQLYKEKLAWVASTLTVGGKRRGGFPSSGSGGGKLPRRCWDESGTVSVVAPAGWAPIELQGDELLCIARRGGKTEPRLFVNRWEGAESASLALTKIARDWKANFKTARFERMGDDPPRMIVRGRDADWVDYFIASFDGKVGCTVRLTARRGGFDDLREVADEAAQSLAFLHAPYFEAKPPGRDISKEYKDLVVVHAKAELAGDLETMGKEFEGFLKAWKRHGVDIDRRAAPLHVVLSNESEFRELSGYFGEPPAQYDRARRCVTVLPPPNDGAAEWRGAVYRAFAEAMLHRDLTVAPPPWFRRGLADCLRAAGAAGEAEGEIPEYVGRLQQRAGESKPDPLPAVLGWSEGDFRSDASLDKAAHAWGYLHLMKFGRGSLSSDYKKWQKSLEKARNTAPAFSSKKADEAPAELAGHVAKTWGGGD